MEFRHFGPRVILTPPGEELLKEGRYWEALLDRRADLLIGAAEEGPADGAYTAKPLGRISFVFVVAPGHPLAAFGHTLGKADLSEHRAVSVANPARVLQARTVGLLFGQDTLSVSDMQTKYQFQLAGLGFGSSLRYQRDRISSGLAN